MSWYNLHKQSNALPFDIVETKKPSSGYGVSYIDDTMTEETATKEKETTPKYLGSGFWGVVVDIGNNRVRKYTGQKQEAEKAQSMIGSTKYPVVKVFNVHQLQPNLWAIDMEKCTPLKQVISNDETEIIDSFLYMLKGLSGNKKELYDDIKGVLSNIRVNISENITAKYNPQFTAYLTRMLYPLFKLKEIGLLWDCKIENIVVNKRGDWVLCDLAPDTSVRNASNWYEFYKKANALPFDDHKDIKDPYGYHKGLDEIDTVMTPETASKERENPQLRYLDSGNSTVVVDIGNNRVKKYTKNKKEAYNAKLLTGRTEYPIAHIYNVTKLQDDLWSYDMEKVEKLENLINTSPYKEIIFKMFEIFESSKTFEIFTKNLSKSITDQKTSNKYLHQFANLYTLSEVDLLWDCCVNNLGINKDGNWVLFDIGVR